MGRTAVSTVNEQVPMTSANAPAAPHATDAAVAERFEQIVMPHVDSAFNLARWIVRNRDDAEDVAQEAMLRALRFFSTYNGGDPRAWLLQIVRNSSYTWLEKNRPADLAAEFDEDIHTSAAVPAPTNPESLAIAANDRQRLERALETLQPKQREVIVLRELEGCSYKEIAAITEIPIGTVMSALSRARTQLQSALSTGGTKEISRGV
jgi:RNA polymerase sigma-70 factor, ECF subfamily